MTHTADVNACGVGASRRRRISVGSGRLRMTSDSTWLSSRYPFTAILLCAVGAGRQDFRALAQSIAQQAGLELP